MKLGQSKKLHSQWTGPYKIIHVVSDVLRTITTHGQWNQREFTLTTTIDRLKPYSEPIPGSPYPNVRLNLQVDDVDVDGAQIDRPDIDVQRTSRPIVHVTQPMDSTVMFDMPRHGGDSDSMGTTMAQPDQTSTTSVTIQPPPPPPKRETGARPKIRPKQPAVEEDRTNEWNEWNELLERVKKRKKNVTIASSTDVDLGPPPDTIPEEVPENLEDERPGRRRSRLPIPIPPLPQPRIDTSPVKILEPRPMHTGLPRTGEPPRSSTPTDTGRYRHHPELPTWRQPQLYMEGIRERDQKKRQEDDDSHKRKSQGGIPRAGVKIKRSKWSLLKSREYDLRPRK